MGATLFSDAEPELFVASGTENSSRFPPTPDFL
jgi:hypothetical protein